jgi:hypothetical protein
LGSRGVHENVQRCSSDDARSFLQIGEFRLLTADTRYDHWMSHEPSIAIELFSITINKKHCWLQSETYGVIGLHALARRYERCPQRDLETILADCKAIISHHAAVLHQQDFTVPCANGCWLGGTVDADFTNGAPARKVLAIRTFICESMMEAA